MLSVGLVHHLLILSTPPGKGSVAIVRVGQHVSSYKTLLELDYSAECRIDAECIAKP